MILRAADVIDARELGRLRAASLCELALLAPSDRAAFAVLATQHLLHLLRTGRVAAWVACDDERVVGSACVVYYDRLPYVEGLRHAEVSGVFVLPAYRGRGLATELVREVVAIARTSARNVVVRPTKGAKTLYSRLGFVETDEMVLANNVIVAKSATLN